MPRSALTAGGRAAPGPAICGGSDPVPARTNSPERFVLRQISSALGQTKPDGHPQMVRSLVAPMDEAAAETRLGNLHDAVRSRIRTHAAAVDNIALFFGEDSFRAISSILLIKGFLEANRVFVEPLKLSVWAIPPAIAALLVHGIRLVLLDRSLARQTAEASQ